jgi:hypothetical protein
MCGKVVDAEDKMREKPPRPNWQLRAERIVRLAAQLAELAELIRRLFS